MVKGIYLKRLEMHIKVSVISFSVNRECPNRVGGGGRERKLRSLCYAFAPLVSRKKIASDVTVVG